MSRECCRRTFRGCLRIPGCTGLCYKCVVPICYGGTESDEEKEDKDEGYASCGGVPSERQSPINEHSKVRLQITDENRKDEVTYENDDTVNLQTKSGNESTDRLYVPMDNSEKINGGTCTMTTAVEFESRTYVNVSGDSDPTVGLPDPSLTGNSILRNDNPSTYVNTEENMTHPLSVDNCTYNINYAQRTDGGRAFNKETEASGLSCRREAHDGHEDALESDRLMGPKDNEVVNIDTEKDITVPSRSTIIDSPTKRQTLVLLETDL